MSNKESFIKRQSGIELLKIIAMFGIVFYHCELSLTMETTPFKPYVNIMEPASNITYFITQLIYYLGKIGNVCFLICSSWFLVDSNKIKLNKISSMLSDVWVFSVLFLLLFMYFGVDCSFGDKIRCLFPTIFGNNWFITCYLLLYAIHPLLNIVINNISQKQHSTYGCILFILYFCFNTIISSLFFASNLIFFVSVYFIIAYAKKYMKIISNQKFNIICFVICLILLISLQLMMNFAGLYIDMASSRIFHFATMNNPILFLLVFSLFNIFRNIKIKSDFINYISSMTILIYIIHENYLFKLYVRHYLMFKFWKATGEINIVLFLFICGIILFVFSALIAIIYNKISQPLVHKLAEKLLQVILKLYTKFENHILKVE